MRLMLSRPANFQDAVAMNDPSLEKEIVSRLDRKPASRIIRARIAYLILKASETDNDLVDDVMVQYTYGFEDKDLLEEITDRLHGERMFDDASKNMPLFSLAWGVLPNDDVLDGHLAEYYFMWGQDIGVSETEVAQIFDDQDL